MEAQLTFQGADSSGRRTSRRAMALAVLIAAAAPTVACETSRPIWLAGAQGAQQTVATFIGEFVDGAPVYRLPTITVVTRREFEFAGAPRDAAQPHAARSPASSAPKPRAG